MNIHLINTSYSRNKNETRLETKKHLNLNWATILFDYVLHSTFRFHRFQREQGTLYKRFRRLPVRDQVGSLFICLNTSRGDARPLVFKLRATWSFVRSLPLYLIYLSHSHAYRRSVKVSTKLASKIISCLTFASRHRERMWMCIQTR